VVGVFGSKSRGIRRRNLATKKNPGGQTDSRGKGSYHKQGILGGHRQKGKERLAKFVPCKSGSEIGTRQLQRLFTQKARQESPHVLKKRVG